MWFIHLTDKVDLQGPATDTVEGFVGEAKRCRYPLVWVTQRTGSYSEKAIRKGGRASNLDGYSVPHLLLSYFPSPPGNQPGSSFSTLPWSTVSPKDLLTSHFPVPRVSKVPNHETQQICRRP